MSPKSTGLWVLSILLVASFAVPAYAAGMTPAASSTQTDGPSGVSAQQEAAVVSPAASLYQGSGWVTGQIQPRPLASSHQSIAPVAISLPRPNGFTPKVQTEMLGVASPRSPNGPALPNLTTDPPNDGFCGFAPGSCGNLAYNGGDVMNSNVQIVLDFWAGSSWSCTSGLFDNPAIDPTAPIASDCNYTGIIQSYITSMCADGQFTDLLQQYLFIAVFSPVCHLYVPTISGVSNPVVDTSPYPETPLSDGDIQSEALAAANFEGLTNSGTNTLVIVFLPNGVGECFTGGNCFPTGNFCAYHQSFGTGFLGSGPNVMYAILPDVATGKGCSISATSPNLDLFADDTVNVMSHEQMEAMTDPNGDAWECGSLCSGKALGGGGVAPAEIGDLCNFDSFGQEPDGSTVSLSSSPFVIQTEWSNSNNGCTRDLAGAPDSVTVKVTPDTSTAPHPSPTNFVVRFEEAGDVSPSSVTSTQFVTPCCTIGSTTVFVTPSSSVLTLPQKAPSAVCFDTKCKTQVLKITKPVTIGYFYYDMVLEHPYMKIIDGGSPPSTIFTYLTAPKCTTKCSSVADVPSSFSVKLPTSPGGISLYIITGTPATVKSCVPTQVILGIILCGNTNGIRWLTGGPCTGPQTCSTALIASAPNSITNINYWHQLRFFGSYSVAGGGKLCGLSPCYSPPTISGTELGKPFTVSLSTTGAPVWLDASTNWGITSILTGSSSSEQWATGDILGGTMTAPVIESFTFNHQYLFTISFSLVGGSTAFVPQLSGTTLGTVSPSSVGTTPTGRWLDSGSSWSLSNPLPGSSSTERWETTATTSGIVTMAYTAALVYQDQFFVTFVATPGGHGTVTPGSGWFNSGATVSIKATPASGFAFSSWTSSSPGIAIASASSATTTATINGSGIITAKFT